MTTPELQTATADDFISIVDGEMAWKADSLQRVKQYCDDLGGTPQSLEGYVSLCALKQWLEQRGGAELAADLDEWLRPLARALGEVPYRLREDGRGLALWAGLWKLGRFGDRDLRFSTRRLPPRVGFSWNARRASSIASDPDVPLEVTSANASWNRNLPSELLTRAERGSFTLLHDGRFSLGSWEGVDHTAVQRTARLAEALRASLVTDDLAFSKAGGRRAPHPYPIRLTRKALGVVCENVERVQRSLPVPLSLANPPWLPVWTRAEMDEAEFLGEVVRRTEAYLTLDLNHLDSYCADERLRPSDYLSKLPLERLALLRIGEREGSTPRLWTLLEEVLAHTGRVTVICTDGSSEARLEDRFRGVAQRHPPIELRRRELHRPSTASSDRDARLIRSQWQLLAAIDGEVLPPDETEARGVRAAAEEVLNRRGVRTGAFE